MLTLYVFSMTFSGKSHNGLQQTIPALFIKMSTAPTSVFNVFAASKTFSRFDISTTYPLHEIPSASNSSTVRVIAKFQEKNIFELIWLLTDQFCEFKEKKSSSRIQGVQVCV